MKYYQMVPVNEVIEFLNVVDGKVCNLSDDQRTKVKNQVQSVWGDTDFDVSLKGVVFSPEGKTLGRIDADYNFIEK